jgi:GH24 family phage-related lysozyme (muramidase)
MRLLLSMAAFSGFLAGLTAGYEIEHSASLAEVAQIRAEIASREAKDADRIWREAAACIGDVPLYQYEADAYASLAYNIGSSAFCRSTIVKRLKQTLPDYAGACEEILMLNRAGGQVLPGLVKRREAEYRMCKGDAP